MECTEQFSDKYTTKRGDISFFIVVTYWMKYDCAQVILKKYFSKNVNDTVPLY